MIQPLQLSPVTEALLECARFERQPVQSKEALEALGALRVALGGIFGTIAQVLAANPSRRGWKADRERPGYLVQTVGDLEIRVPWNLITDFPQSEILTELGELARRIRSGPDTAICLSGSSTFYTTLQAIGDVDFCEYVELSAPGRRRREDRSFARTVRKAARLDDGDLTCLAIKILASDPSGNPTRAVRQRPWSPLPTEDIPFLKLAERTVCGKCDFVAHTRFEGILEMTNLVLLVHPESPEEGAGQLSFTPQEAPLTGVGGWVPRRLEDPRALGRYINWLWGEILHHLTPEHTDLGKAMKRALALTRILFLDTQSEELLSILEDQKLMLRLALKARLSLRSKLGLLRGDPSTLRFEAPLLQTVLGLAERLAEPGLAVPQKGATDEIVASWCNRADEALDATMDQHAGARQRIQSLVADLSGLL